MWQLEDTTYRDLRENSLDQWLDEMAAHEDLQVRGGCALGTRLHCVLEKRKPAIAGAESADPAISQEGDTGKTGKIRSNYEILSVL